MAAHSFVATGDGRDDDLVRFPCDGCGKLIGADPTMATVTCGRCGLGHPVPTPRAAVLMQTRAVRVVAVDVPLDELLPMGLRIAVAAIPLVLVLAVAACGVVLFARWVWAAG